MVGLILMKLEVKIVSDIVCPWCYIGESNWEKGSSEWKQSHPEVSIDVEFKPFRLDPNLPMEGVPRDEVLSQKFGSKDQMEKILARTIKAGKEVGVPIEFQSGVMQPNTLQGHRLIRLAKDYNLQREMVASLFRSYFAENLNLTEQDVLTLIALNVGIPKSALDEFWTKDQYRDEILEEEKRMRDLGVTGVPFFIINDSFDFSGAQPPEVVGKILDQVLAEGGK